MSKYLRSKRNKVLNELQKRNRRQPDSTADDCSSDSESDFQLRLLKNLCQRTSLSLRNTNQLLSASSISTSAQSTAAQSTNEGKIITLKLFNLND